MMKFFVLAAVVDAAGLTDPKVTPASLEAGAKSIHTVTFTAGKIIPDVGGKIEITYPTGFKLPASVAATVSQGFTNTVTAVVSQQKITLTLVQVTGGGSLANAAIIISLPGITNPTTLGDTTVFPIATTGPNAAALDSGDAPFVKIIPATTVTGKLAIDATCDPALQNAADTKCITGAKCDAATKKCIKDTKNHAMSYGITAAALLVALMF